VRLAVPYVPPVVSPNSSLMHYRRVFERHRACHRIAPHQFRRRDHRPLPAPAGWFLAGMLRILMAWICCSVRNCNRAIRLVFAYGTQTSPLRSSSAKSGGAGAAGLVGAAATPFGLASGRIVFKYAMIWSILAESNWY